MRRFWTITSPQDLAHALKGYRLHRQLTQKELADAIGMRQATVSAFERSPEKAKADTVFRILTALHLKLTLTCRNRKISLED